MAGKQIRAFMALCVLVFVAVGMGAGEAAAAPPVKSDLQWNKCFQTEGPFECTTVQVPLDYNESSGAISLSVVRLPATDQAHRIGSLFLNPGGPGGSGVDFTVGAGQFLFTPEVRARFDLVGFDPRGIARSTALRCFGTPKQWGPFFTPFAFPLTPEEEEAWMASDRFLNDACAQRGGLIIDHMSTANVARDMERLREAVGDAKLTYYGVSYGSFLGQVYANMFPNNFRALVIDGVLDPIAWVNQGSAIPFSTALRSDDGAMKTLNEFFRLCDAGGEEKSDFAPDSADRYKTMADKLLEDGPVEITLPDGSTEVLNYSNLISLTLGPMYDSPSWEDFAGFLAFLEEQVVDTAAATKFSGKFDATVWRPGYISKRGFPKYPNFLEGFPAVACADSDNPDSYAAWSAAAAGMGRLRLLRPALDVDHEHLRRVARRGCGPVHGAVQPCDAGPRPRRGEPLRPGDAVRRRRDRGRPTSELGAADSCRLGPHVAVPVGVRRQRDRAVPDRCRDAGGGHRLQPGPRALLGRLARPRTPPIPLGHSPSGIGREQRHQGLRVRLADLGSVPRRRTPLPGASQPDHSARRMADDYILAARNKIASATRPKGAIIRVTSQAAAR